jgi:hypothetical protein
MSDTAQNALHLMAAMEEAAHQSQEDDGARHRESQGIHFGL